MIRLFIRHSVAHFAVWKQVYDAFDAERKSLGAHGNEVVQNVDDPNDVTGWHDFESLEAARVFAGNPILLKKMSEAGVTSEPTIWFGAPT